MCLGRWPHPFINLHARVGADSSPCASSYLAYLLVLVVSLLALQWAYSLYRRKRWQYRKEFVMPTIYTTISAIIGTWSTVLAKALSGLLQSSLSDFSSMMTWLTLCGWLGGLAFWLYRMNHALAKFEPPQFIIPLLQVCQADQTRHLADGGSVADLSRPLRWFRNRCSGLFLRLSTAVFFSKKNRVHTWALCLEWLEFSRAS